MKLIHLSDLHIGKNLHHFSLIEDQAHILNEIINIIADEKPHAVLIAGDVYDTTMPSTDAVRLFDDFLHRASELVPDVFMISGNHDSADRLSFGSKLMVKSGVHIAKGFSGGVERIKRSDEFGGVNFYLLPFVRVPEVRRFFPDITLSSANDAVRAVLETIELDEGERNVLIAHQYVSGADLSESESSYIGGTDAVEAALFEDFDYVALGHLHRAQSVHAKHIRYCGTPLKYSRSELRPDKTVSVIELGKKGELDVREIPLKPLHDLRELRGSYNELMLKQNYENTAVDDYVYISLTDEPAILDAANKMRVVYKNLLDAVPENIGRSARSSKDAITLENAEAKTPFEIFAELFEIKHGHGMSEEQAAFLNELIEKAWEEE